MHMWVHVYSFTASKNPNFLNFFVSGLFVYFLFYKYWDVEKSTRETSQLRAVRNWTGLSINKDQQRRNVSLCLSTRYNNLKR